MASNAYWEELEVTLPTLPMSLQWQLAVNTWEAEQRATAFEGSRFRIGPRSVMVFVGK